MNEDAGTEHVLPNGLLGHLDDCERRVVNGSDVLYVRGWIFGRQIRIQSLILRRQNAAAIPIPYWLPRLDVAEYYPGYSRAVISGFAGQLTLGRVPVGEPLPDRVDICAVLEDGREVCCFSRHFYERKPAPPEPPRVPTESFPRKFARKAIAAWHDGRTFSAPKNALKRKLRALLQPPAVPIEPTPPIPPEPLDEPPVPPAETEIAAESVISIAARVNSQPGRRILMLDDRVPHYRHGAGFPRACEMIQGLVEGGYFVTFYAVTMPLEDWAEIYADIPCAVEVMMGWGAARLAEFIRQREGFYDWIIISRPHNMKTFRSIFWRDGQWLTKTRVIYDAEAVSAFREAEQRRLFDFPVTQDEITRLLREEMSLTHGVDAVFSVTDHESNCFRSSGVRTVWTLGHTVKTAPTPRAFEDRAGFLFVGAMGGLPNWDAVRWLSREIWPKVRPVVGEMVTLTIVGTEPPALIRATPGIDAPGPFEDLLPHYDRARVFVAPSRLAAGIPIKVLTAAAHGVPVVCTSILADELGWTDGVEILVADDPETFAQACIRLYSDAALWNRLRANALARVERNHSQQAFRASLTRAVQP